jgi:hypothetical protein
MIRHSRREEDAVRILVRLCCVAVVILIEYEIES